MTQAVLPDVTTRFTKNILVNTKTHKRFLCPDRMTVVNICIYGPNVRLTVEAWKSEDCIDVQYPLAHPRIHEFVRIACRLAEQKHCNPCEEVVPVNLHKSGN